MFISPAYAQAAGGGQGDLFTTLMPLILIGLIFYFLLIRPQQKRIKQHRDMVSNLRRGDKVVTSGGIVGTVTKILNDTEAQVEIAENVRVRVLRTTISDVLEKTEPANSDEKKSGEEPKRGGFKLFGGGKSNS